MRVNGAARATRRLEAAGVSFRVHRYDPDEVLTGIDAARVLAIEPFRMLKSLVARRSDGRFALALIPVSMRLDLQALAQAVGAATCMLADPATAELATGSGLGAISPLGLSTPLPIVVDSRALDAPSVFVSGGARGLEIELRPSDLVRLCGATCAPIAYSTGPVAKAR